MRLVAVIAVLLVTLAHTERRAEADTPCATGLPEGVTCFEVPRGTCYIVTSGGGMAGKVSSISCFR